MVHKLMRSSIHVGGWACLPMLLLLGHPATSQRRVTQELVEDGDFREHPRRVSGENLFDFPGSKDSGLSVQAGSSAVSIRSAAVTNPSGGWYRVQFFAHALPGYGDLPVIVDVVGSDGSRLAPAFSISLRAARGEWLHYNELVPCNPPGTTAARVTVASGRDMIQVTGLSIRWEHFDNRGLEAVPWSTTSVEAACPVQSDGATIECPTGFGEPTLSHSAFDNNWLTSWLIAAEVPAGSGEYPPMALQLQFDTPESTICGARILFDDSSYPTAWRFLAKEGDGRVAGIWRTWVEARTSWVNAPEDSVAGGVQPLTVTGGGWQQFGVACSQIHSIRIEMQSTLRTLFYKTYEIELLTAGDSESSCACRHGGLCLDGGTRCSCPMALADCVEASCGWGGPTCQLAACDANIVCDNLGFCGGPNTCTCQPGFYGTSGLSQCGETRCGDGFMTKESNGVLTGEECDDGNNEASDGCSPTCKVETLPFGFQRTLSQTGIQMSVPLAVLSTRDVTTATLARDLNKLEQQITITGRDSEKVYYVLREFEVICDIVEMCESASTAKCIMQNGGPTCVCQEGFTGDRCQTSMCTTGCAHGGRCTGTGTCTDCGAGWDGSFCGTASPQTAKDLATAFAFGAIVALSVGLIIVILRRGWIPIRARGAASLCASFIGGIVWILSAFATVSAERFSLDVGRSEPAGLWGTWMPFVAGFGLWLTANVTHLRAMVKIHIFVEVPTAFFPHMMVAGLLPWAGAAYFERGLIATILCVMALLYVVLELAQVWQLRRDLDVVESSVATILGIACMLWGRFVIGAADAQFALMYPIATANVVLLHFLATSGRLLWLSLCDRRNVEILKEYHNDYAPVRGSLRDSMLSFDMEVQVRREKTPVQLRDNSFHARVRRTKIGQKAAEPLRASGQFLRDRIAPKPGGSFRRMQGSFSDSFKLVSESFRATRIGIEVSRSSFDRKQFGARKKLGQKTLENMSRRAGASHVYACDEEQAQSTTARRGAVWRENATSRVEKQTGKSPTKTSSNVAKVQSILVTSPRYDGTRGGRGTSKAQATTYREKAKMILPGEILVPAPARQLPAVPNDNSNYKRKSRGGAEPKLQFQ